jgi:hypothetical protein
VLTCVQLTQPRIAASHSAWMDALQIMRATTVRLPRASRIALQETRVHTQVAPARPVEQENARQLLGQSAATTATRRKFSAAVGSTAVAVVGKYTVSTGSVSCTSCPTGKTSVPGSVSAMDGNLDNESTVRIRRMVVFLPMTVVESDDDDLLLFFQKQNLAR